MDARDELRRLLRQRLEDGESTIVLESLTATQVAAAVTSLAPSGIAPRADRPSTPSTPVRETLDQRRAAAPEGAADWRAALQATGATPGTKSTESIVPATKAPAPKRGRVVVTPDAPLPLMNSL